MAGLGEGNTYKMFIECQIVGGEALHGVETSEVVFFDADHLPPLSLERNTEAQIRTMFEFLNDPTKSVILD